MSYTNVFTGSTIYPTEVALTKLDMTANVVLYWPVEAPLGVPLASEIVEITSSTSTNWTIKVPDAMLVSIGQTILFNNRTAVAISVVDYNGASIVSVPAGTQWQIYLATNTTQAGVWRQYQFGAATSTANAAALAGHGLRATGSELETAVVVTDFSTNYTLTQNDHAGMFNCTSSGVTTLTLPVPAVIGTAWYVQVRNSGAGTLTVDTTGTALIDGSATKVFSPGDSALIAHNGTDYYSVGFGQSATFAFDYVEINVSGNTDYTLSGNELNRIAYQFTGVLTGDITVIVPNTVQQYWVYNNTTGGFDLSVGTASQVSPLLVVDTTRTIVYCDGADIVPAVTAFVVGAVDGGSF
jgi:hypothetical protein